MPAQFSEALSLLAGVLRAGGRRFAALVALSVVAAGLESAALAALPVLLKANASGTGIPFFDSGAGMAALPVLLAGYVVLVAVTAALVYFQTAASAKLVLDYGESLRMRLHRAVTSAGWGTPVLARAADLIHALTSEAGQCSYAVQIVLNATTRVLYLPPLLIAALILSPGFTLAAVLIAALASLPMLPLNRQAYRMAGAMAQASRAVNAEITDQMAGLRVLKIFRAEALRSEDYRRRLTEARDVQLAQTRATALVTAGQRVMVAAAAAAGGYYGLAVLHLDKAALLALVLVFARLTGGIRAIQDFWRQLARLLPVHAQLAARLDACLRSAEPAAAGTPPRLRRAIRLEGAGMTYPGASVSALSEIDLVLPALSITALAGPSGAGKSTLADLIMGLTAPAAGRIFVDDQPLEGPARVAWRSRVAYVPQDSYLFHDTIRANLRIARPDAPDAMLIEALGRAAARFVLALPDGLDTIVGDRGARLSGGERQRIALARALLMAPDLLVLDEATNALDPGTESEVIETLRALAGRITILLIAHGPSALAVADHAVWIEAGRIVRRATRLADPDQVAPSRTA